MTRINFTQEKLDKWDSSRTIKENAHLLGLKVKSCRNFQRRNKLVFLRLNPSPEHLEKRKLILELLKDKKLSYGDIAAVIGCSRQHIHQVKQRWGKG